MLGVFRIEQSGSAVTKFLFESGYDNAFVVDAQQIFQCQIGNFEWRRMLARGVDDSVPLDVLLPAYIAKNRQSLAPTHLKKQNDFSWIRAEFERQDTRFRLLSTSVVQTPSKPVAATGLIMAGGFGRRLGELTRDVPKPMLDLGGKPIAGHLLDNLVASGIKDVFLSVHYLPHVVKRHFGDGASFGARVGYLEENAPLGTAGCLSLLPKDLNQPIVMVNGDVVTDVQFGRLLEFHQTSGLDVTVSVRPMPMQVQFGVVEQVDGLVTRIREKPKFVHQINVAVYVLSPRVLAHIPKGKRIDMPTLIENLMPLNYNIGVFPLVEKWLDVGTVAELNKARAEYDQVMPIPAGVRRGADVVSLGDYRATA